MQLIKETNLYDDDAISEALLQTVSNIFYDENMFNILTHNGAIQGLFWDNGQVYANMNYLRSGTIKVGGNGNVNGLLEVYNASQTVTCRLNNTGLYAIAGTVGGMTLANNNLHNGMTSLSDTSHDGVYVGTDGIALGKGKFKATSAGAVIASNITVTGGSITGNVITAGKIQSSDGYVYFDLDNNNLVCDKLTGTNNAYNRSLSVRIQTTNGRYYADGVTISASGYEASGVAFRPCNTNTSSQITYANEIWMGGNPGTTYARPFTLWVPFGTMVSSSYDLSRSCLNFDVRNCRARVQCNVAGVQGSTFGPELSLYGYDSGVPTSTYKTGIDISAGIVTMQGLRTEIKNLVVSGTKSREVQTDSYGNTLLYSYETPSPMFGDVGEGEIGDDGKCYVYIDSVFANTVTLSQYQVFLQKYGNGDCYVSERNSVYFVVTGTPGLQFGWELKAKQHDYDQVRFGNDSQIFTNDNLMDYGSSLVGHIEDIQREREVAA